MKALLKLNYDDNELTGAIIHLSDDQTSIDFDFEIPEKPASLLQFINDLESGKKQKWVPSGWNEDISIDTDGSKTNFHIGKYGGDVGAGVVITVQNSIVLSPFQELKRIIQSSQKN